MKNFTFGTLEYVRPDVDAFEEKLKGFTERIKNAKSYAEVKAVILENDKVMSSLYTMLTVASIRNTLNTTDEFYEKEVAFTDERLPAAAPTEIAFTKAILDCPFTKELEEDLGKEYLVAAKRSLDRFNDKLVPFMQEENRLTTEYQKLMATAQIEFDGKTLNLYGIQKYFENPDREVRRAAFKKYSEFYESNEERLENIFSKLVDLRTRMGKALGYDTFTPLGYLQQGDGKLRRSASRSEKRLCRSAKNSMKHRQSVSALTALWLTTKSSCSRTETRNLSATRRSWLRKRRRCITI